MRAILLIASGAVLCLVIEVGFGAYWKLEHPLGTIKNSDYNLVHVANKPGDRSFDLHKGESRLLGYGEYIVTIPDANASFTLWKNNRGYCNIHSGNGVPVVQTEGNCVVDGQIDQKK